PTSLFDSSDADLILRSCDGADFRLHKAVLSLVSPVFRDMFTFPQPESALELSVVDSIVPTAKQYLERYVVDEPLPAYSVAYKLQWKDIAIAAAKQTLKHRLRALDAVCPPALENFPASAYYNLIRYHYLCGLAATGVTTVIRWVPAQNNLIWFTCTSCAQA
ncbi:hypothetical protein B0H14DRAFT_2344163, partial [Mycena olivaceomarginata]